MPVDKILLTNLEKQKIKSETPDKLPLNPTAQGWTGQQVRNQLSKSVHLLTDEVGNKLEKVKEVLEDIPGNFPELFDAERFVVSKDEPEDQRVTLWFEEE